MRCCPETISSTGSRATSTMTWRKSCELGGSAPAFLDVNILELIAHQFADARCAVDMRDNLHDEIGFGQASHRLLFVGHAMLVTHRGERTERPTVVQLTDDHIAFVAILGCASFFGKPHNSRPPAIGAW